MSKFAETILQQKYSHLKKDGTLETWENIAYRVTKNVMKSVDAEKDLTKRVEKAIVDRKFIPGGRYLYSSGRSFHQTQNCFEGKTRIVTRNGTKTLKELVNQKTIVMSTEGQWKEAEIRSFGIQPLMKVTLTRAGIEKEIFATPNHSWRIAKAEGPNGRSMQKCSVVTECLTPGDRIWSVFGYGLTRTTPSLAGIQHGLVFGDGNVPKDEFGFNTANIRLCGNKDAEFIKYFNGYRTRKIGEDTEVSGLPRHYKEDVSLNADRSYLFGWLAGYFAADGCVSKEGVVTLATTNRENLELVKNVAYLLGVGVFGIREQSRISNLTNEESIIYTVAFDRSTLTEDFFLCSEHKTRFNNNPQQRRFNWNVKSVERTDRYEEVFCAVVPDTHEFVLEDNILTGNCLLLSVEDSRESWAELMHKITISLMTGAGIGVVYSNLRAKGKKIRRSGGQSTGPIALMQMVNEAGRGIMQGGSRRSAIWAGLHWNHPDIHEFITLKNWSKEVRDLKEKDFNFPATMDGTNISVILDDDFFEAFHNEKHEQHSMAHSVYWKTVKQMLQTAEPGFSIDSGKNSGEHLRNACTEVTSRDDSDICNLGSINLARITSLEEMKEIVELGTAFLLAGTVYSDVPYPKVDQVRTKNRRLGLGLMGVHEFLLLNQQKYDISSKLEEYLKIYEQSTIIAGKYAKEWGLSKPVKTRAIAPTGSIGIIGETTTGIEPIFCVAYKRRYLKHNTWHYQYVIDPTAKKLIDSGINPDHIEDAYSLAEDVERRVKFQAWMQKYVDHAISSTINLPAWGSETNNEQTIQKFGDMLIKYLPDLRGMTVYPDGSRSGQPITPVKYDTAMKHVGEIFIEQTDICDITKAGSCGT